MFFFFNDKFHKKILFYFILNSDSTNSEDDPFKKALQLRQICSHCEIVKVVWIYFIINFTESNFLWKRQFDNTVNSEELSNYVKEWEKTKDREREFKKPPVYLMKKYVWILSRSSVSFICKIINTQKKHPILICFSSLAMLFY